MTQPLLPDCPRVDISRTLGELTGVDWGAAPLDARLAVAERHATRCKRLADWSHRELIRFLCIGADQHLLVPVAVARLQDDPVASGCDRAGELLSATLESEGFDWRAHPGCVHAIRELVDSALNLIGQDDDVPQATSAGWHVYRSWAIFERRLSTIP